MSRLAPPPGMLPPSPSQPIPGAIGFEGLLRRVRLETRHLMWFGTFISLSAYLLGNKFGQIAAAVTIGVWIVYGLAYPARSARWMLAAPLVWLFPLFAAGSTLWSIEPAITQRLSTELMVFTGCGLLMAQTQSVRSFLSALLCALMLAVGASMIFGETAQIGLTGEIAFIGLFGSKNNFAFVTCLLLFASIAVLADRDQSRHFRRLAAIGLLLAPAVLVRTISIGAFVSGALGSATLVAVLIYSRVAPRWRGAFLLMCAGFGLAVVAFIGFAITQGITLDSLLASVGKDPGLTGRTFLWARAESFIAERPLFGLGYQAFWVQGHVEAEGLWRYADIENRGGFHFHNLFFATAVELGYFGVAILAIQVLATFAAITAWTLRRPGPESGFFFALFVFFLIRMPVELDFLSPFSYGALIVPLAWAIATRRHAPV